ncbi:MAG: hypothetical protein QM775_29700 [Pirellulales bacterium]
MSSAEPNPLLTFLRRRWMSLVVAAVLAGVGGFAVAQKFAVKTYTCFGSMLYNRSSAGAPQYQQPEMQSIVSLVKSQPVLEDAASRLAWNPPAPSLAGGIQTEGLIGSSTLQFTMCGSEPEQTRESLNAIMQALIRQAGELRSRTLRQILASHETYLAKATVDADAAAAVLSRFNHEHRITVDLDDDLERVRDDIAAVETALETNQSTRTSPEEQLQRRRQLLTEQQEADRSRLEREASLQLKRNEFECAKRLHAKRYISDSEFRRIETEYATLDAQNNEAFSQRRARLNQLGEALAEQLNRAGSGEPGDDPDAAARMPAFAPFLRSAARRPIALTRSDRKPTICGRRL